MNMTDAASEGTLLDARHPNAGRADHAAHNLWIAGAWPEGPRDRPATVLPEGAGLPAGALAGGRGGGRHALPGAVMPVPPAEAEQIALLFTILGWQLEPAGPARLALFHDGDCIRVVPDDPALAAPLSAAGLDRLVLPLSLASLEDLATLAG